MTERLRVYWEKDLVGFLSLDERDEMSFQYAREWLNGPSSVLLSIRFPFREEPYLDSDCRTFFSNLLPEGNVRTMVARKLGISETNEFQLLKALGGDCAGALSFIPEGEEPSESGGYEPVTLKEIDELLEGSVSNPLLVCRAELRLSLAGAQQKLPVYIEEGKIHLPRGTFPSSHILKPKVSGFDQIVENEAFCMTLAREAGLPVPAVTVLSGKEPIYLVERYDRRRDEQKKLRRLHQEDFCQALGFPYTRKYETEGGPNLQQCFSLITDKGTEPLIDKKVLIQWVVFNYLIGNCDAHAKNISILMTRKNYRLAPLYDLLSTRVYPSLSAKLAMKIGGEIRPEWVLREHWEQLAKDAGVGLRAVVDNCQMMCKDLPPLAFKTAEEFTRQYGGKEIIQKICNHIASTSKRTIEGKQLR